MANKNTWRRRWLQPARPCNGPVISQNLARNMELVRADGRTLYRPIDARKPSFPARTEKLNALRRSWGPRLEMNDTSERQAAAGTTRQTVPVAFAPAAVAGVVVDAGKVATSVTGTAVPVDAPVALADAA